MRKNNSYKLYVTGNRKKGNTGKVTNPIDIGGGMKAMTAPAANTNKVIKRDKGH